MKTSDGTLVLDYFRQLSEAQDHRPAGEVLKEVAALFGATQVGIGGMNSDAADLVYSAIPNAILSPGWRTDAQLLQRLRGCWTALAHAEAQGEWLICLAGESSGESRMVWAYRAGKPWTDEEKLLWMLAAQGLLRWLHYSGADTWAQGRRLEQAAVITSRLSHDFGNYLTGILGFTELSLSQAALDSTLHRYLDEVLESAKQGADWIRRLHAFCRRGSAPAWPTQLASVIAQEETRLRATGLFGMRWQTQLPQHLPLLALDAGDLQTALAEITANAREATKDQGTITFAARAMELSATDCQALLGAISPGPCVELCICDDGSGIAPEHRAKLFQEIFFSTKMRHRGLGLLVVYGVLERCRGGLRMEPASSGKGTCVRLYLPTAAIDGPPFATYPEVPHILLVHTDSLLTSSMREILEGRGCKVSVAGDAQAALAVCRAKGTPVALVITDLMLPHLAGLDLARRILDHDPKTGFVFLLAQSSFHGLREEELLKRFDLLRWPLEPAAFIQAIQSAIARARAAAEPGKSS